MELADKDRDLHRFVWRANKESPVQDYRMTRVTFGVASSPSPSTADDLLAGAEDSESAIELQTQPRQLLLRGGFDLRKWRSSSTQVMEQIDPELHEQEALKSLIDDHSSQHQKTMGMVFICVYRHI